MAFGLCFHDAGEWVLTIIAGAPQLEDAARAPEVATGAAIITFDKASIRIIVPATINGVAARLQLDTGASETVLTAEMAKRAQLVAEGATYESKGMGGGKLKEKAARVALLSVGGSSIKNAMVWVEENSDLLLEGEKLDGLLGLSFLRHFDMRISNGVLELKPLGAKQD